MVLPNSLSSYYEKFLATGEVKCIDDEIPFEIPKRWEWCRLKHMCSMQAGKNISASEIYDKSQFFTHIDVSVEMDYEGLQTHSMQKDILLLLAGKEHYVDALI